MLELKRKQKAVVDAVNDPTVDVLVLIGSVGTGKTDIAAHVGITLCDTFPETYWTVFRKNISTAKRSTIPSYDAMFSKMNFIEGKDYKYNGQDYEYKFPNKSKIGIVEADYTKDRQGQKIKGINATANHIDEADELEETMFVTATSRKGRRNEYDQPSISIITMNPNDSHLKAKYYDKFKDPEKHGALPKNVRVIEFDLEDSWQTEADIDAMKTNPKWWTERYLYNNWDYADEEKTIFKSKVFQRAITKVIEPGRRTTGYDVAEEGRDRSVCADWENFTLYDVQVTKESDQQVDTDVQAKWLMKHSDEEEIGYENIAVDGVGNGVGVIATGRDNDAQFAIYKSGYAPDPFLTFEDKAPTAAEAEKQSEILSFNNLRSQVAYLLMMGMDKGKVKIQEDTPYLKEFINEAQQHYFEVKEKVFILESKEKIKKRTGKSPDIFDAVLMGYWKQLKKVAVIQYGGVR